MSAENTLTEIYRDQWLLVVHKPAGLLVHCYLGYPIKAVIGKGIVLFKPNVGNGRTLGDHRLTRDGSKVSMFGRSSAEWPERSAIVVRRIGGSE